MPGLAGMAVSLQNFANTKLKIGKGSHERNCGIKTAWIAQSTCIGAFNFAFLKSFHCLLSGLLSSTLRMNDTSQP